MSPVDTLFSWEAEENVLGFFFNPYGKEDKRSQMLELVQPEHFTMAKYRAIYESISKHKIFDKIVLWDRIKNDAFIKALNIEWLDIQSIDEFVREEDVDSYFHILLDKYQKRELHEFGKQVSLSMLKGEDQFEVALRAQNILGKMSSEVRLQTNEDLLNKVFSETASDIVSTGFTEIDQYIGGFSRGMIVTVAGDSGHLKTTLALDMAFKMAEKNPTLKVGIFSKEMTDITLVKKQISRICKIPANLIFSQKYDKEFVKAKMMEVEAWRENRIRIIDPGTFHGVGDIARIQMTHRFDIWFLDFIQMLEFSKTVSSSSDYNIQVAQNMRNLLSLSLTTKSVGIVLSQVKKGVEKAKVRRPTISDIEWSGLIKQLSAYILFSYYPVKYYGERKIPLNHYYLMAEKTRFAEGFISPMIVNPEYGIFNEVVGNQDKKQMLDKLYKLFGE